MGAPFHNVLKLRIPLVRPIIRRPALAGVALCVLVLSATGCAQVFDARSLGAKTTLSERSSEQPQGEPFKITKTAVYAFWGVASASQPSLDHLLAGQLTGNGQISNLRITVKSRFSDALITLLTGGVVVPRTITFEGVVTKPAVSPGK